MCGQRWSLSCRCSFGYQCMYLLFFEWPHRSPFHLSSGHMLRMGHEIMLSSSVRCGVTFAANADHYRVGVHSVTNTYISYFSNDRIRLHFIWAAITCLEWVMRSWFYHQYAGKLHLPPTVIIIVYAVFSSMGVHILHDFKVVTIVSISFEQRSHA
jgi:hypothetical protein